MSDNSAIEWTQATWNPVTGCTEVSPGCDHCLAPETLVLYDDFTWRRLGDVQVGDVLIGFDEKEPTEGRERKLKKTIVNAIWKIRQPAMKVTTDKSEIICSDEHRFLAYGFSRWIYAKNFSLGSQLRTIGCFSAQIDNDEYAAGYLMGMTDGDGTWRFTPGQRSDKSGLMDKIAFFTLTQPAMKRKTETLIGTSVDAQAAVVTKLETLGERELVDIETTTHTFFANGLATHNCYALTFAERFRGVPNHPYEQGFDLKLWPDRLTLPQQWKKPRRIFVNSMSDLFHKDVPDDFILDVFETMLVTNQHIYQVLTKRPSRLVNTSLTEKITNKVYDMTGHTQWPSHIWLGVSVENNDYIWRVDALRKVPAAIRFISAEPLLGPLDKLRLDGIHWLISGGESGPGHRPCDPNWIRDLRDRCHQEDVAFFHKQWGGRTPKANGRLLDGRTWDEFPRVELLVV